jgi:hypothetical protein
VATTLLQPRVAGSDTLKLRRLRVLALSFPHVLVAVALVTGALFAHELGHALAATLFGARVVMFNVLGMQWYPIMEWMPQLGFGGYVYWWAAPARTSHWLIVMAGSNFTMLLAITAVLALTLTRPRGLARTSLAVISLYFLDSMIHALPVLGVWRPAWNFRFSRSFSEAHTAAVNLGIPSQVYLAVVFILSAFILVLLFRALFPRAFVRKRA